LWFEPAVQKVDVMDGEERVRKGWIETMRERTKARLRERGSVRMVRKGRIEGSEIEWRRSRGMGRVPVTLGRGLTTCLVLIASFSRVDIVA
jgi:hypothetical protein